MNHSNLMRRIELWRWLLPVSLVVFVLLYQLILARWIHDDFTEGFDEDFFAGIDLQITGPGMVMGLPGMDTDGGMDMGDEHLEPEASMGDMDMEDEHAEDEAGMGDMDMADEHAEDEAGMGDMDMADETGMGDMGDEHTEDEASMGDMAMGDEHTEGEAGSDEMAMGDEHAEDEAGMTDMAMGDEHQDEDEHVEDVASGKFGPFQLPEMDAHAGVMVMIDPIQAETMAGDVTVITFTVPEDKIGTWEFGCFQERGQHYDDGMHGTIIVEG